MLTDTKLRNLKAGEKLFKVNDCDGLYVAVKVMPGRPEMPLVIKSSSFAC